MQTFSPDDYRAVRSAAGVRERQETAFIGVTGTDRLSYLHAMLTNDVAALTPGRGCYAAYLTPQGRMIADMGVLELGDLALVELDGAKKQEVLEKLDQFIFSEDVQLHDLTATLADVAVIGPASPAVVSALFGAADVPGPDHLASLAEFETVRVGFEGASAIVLSSGRRFGVSAFGIIVERDRVPAVIAAAVRAGATQVNEAAVEVVRVEAGVPRFGADMDERTIPLEAGIEGRAISSSKGCYPGQEVIARVLHRGHGRVAKKLVGISVEGTVVPQRGDTLVADGKDVGVVTTAVYSPTLGMPIALGYVQRDLAVAGTAVVIRGHVNDRAAGVEESLRARVVELPFVR
jgi:tRNA-modifying protein YgfZ